jgi:DNA-binding transcriptional LysR family regulator
MRLSSEHLARCGGNGPGVLCPHRVKHYSGIEHVKKLWILEKVVESGSLREAALRARVTPPAISQALAAMEKAVGRPLVIRKDGRVEPTDLARELVRTARPALQTLENISSLASARVPNISWMSLGAYESLSVSLLPGLIATLRAKLPSTKLTIRTGRSAQLANMVRKGELCAALVTEMDSPGRLNRVEVGKDRLGFFVSASASGSVPTFQEMLEHMPLGTIAPGADGYPVYFQKFLRKTLGDRCKPTVLCDSFETLRSAAVAGTLAAVLPARVALRAPGELVEVPPPLEGAPDLGAHSIWLVSLENCDPDEVAFLERELRELLAAST